MYVYVDPWHCVSCTNCFDAAPKTFMMNNKHGKAQAYNQWGDPEVEISWAIDACPVDCISWVTREELQRLEHVTAQELYDTNGEMLCAMQIQQGTISADTDPWEMADQLKRKLKREEERAKDSMAGNAGRAADSLQRRIERVFAAMAHELKLLGWPSYALPAGGS
jgi:ferredoxin